MNKDENKDERKKVISKHKKILSRKIYLVKNSKIDTKGIKDFNSNLERIESVSKNELHLVDNYKDRFLNLNKNYWNIYEGVVTTEERAQGTYEALPDDVESCKNHISLLTKTSISGCSSTRGDYNGMYHTLLVNYSTDNEFKTELEKNEPEDTFWDDVDFIRERMNKIIDTSGDNFYDSINSFFSESKGQRFKRLMDARQAIIENFLDILVPTQAPFCKLPWFTNATGGSPERKLTYGQSKFFAQGSIDDSDIPTSFKEQINNSSYKMLESYKALSDNGHEGTSDEYAQYIIQNAVSNFKSLLELKE